MRTIKLRKWMLDAGLVLSHARTWPSRACISDMAGLTRKGQSVATTVAPKGRMTKPLHTPYSIGDTIRLLVADTGSEGRCPRKGDVGQIRKMYPSDSRDGDKTFLVFDVYWVDYGGIFTACPSDDDFESVARSVYNARRAAKKLALKSRRLANAGADLTEISVAIDQIAKTSEANTAWLRRQLNTLNMRGGA